MKVYLVGGAVRDQLLGLPVIDRDYVVVGASPEEMLAKGFRPVGKDFPVFLHPKTQEEYALARTERKTGVGYHGFEFYYSPDVSLEEDLARRDLTINAMAQQVDQNGALIGPIIDPFCGQKDLFSGVFRHVGSAFAEDPVRILRVARFATRFVHFQVAPETQLLMQTMVAEGEVDALVAERVWQEVSRGLMGEKPSRLFMVLHECGALAHLMPEVAALFGAPQDIKHHPEGDAGMHTMMVIDYSAAHDYFLEERFAALVHDLGKGNTPIELLPRHPNHESRGLFLLKSICQRLKVPVACRTLAETVTKEHGNIHRCFELDAKGLLTLIQRCHGLRNTEYFHSVLKVCEADSKGRQGFSESAYLQRDFLINILNVINSLKEGEIAQRFLGHPEKIQQAIALARIEVIEQYLKEHLLKKI